tara:strand:- start:482 stop:1462 length:981 start_codon:yes stop_codon:yes gene_type:complete
MITSRTPFRIPFAGGGTDIDFYYKKKGGLLISAAIDQYAYALIKKRELDKKILVQTTSTEFVNNVSEIKHNFIREILKYFKIKDSMQLATFSTLPTKSGLGSSSSITVGLLKTLFFQNNVQINQAKLAKEAFKIERKILKLDGGLQDQIVASFGGIIKIKIEKSGKFKVTKLRINKEKKEKIEQNLILIFTKEIRDSNNIIETQRKNVNKKNIIETYDKLKNKVIPMENALINGNIKQIGKIFDDHWKLKKNLSDNISNNYLNKFYTKLMNTKLFYGGKIIGAGGGGFYLMVTKNRKKAYDYIKRKKINFIKVKFDSEGSVILKNN